MSGVTMESVSSDCKLNEASISLVLISSRRLRDDHLDTLESKNNLAVFFKEKVITINSITANSTI